MKLSRRKVLKAVSASVAWIALTSTLPGCEPSRRAAKTTPSQRSRSSTSGYVHAFRSRPDLHPPSIDIATRAHNTAPGYIFVAPKKGAGQNGPMILDNSGQPVWFHPLQKEEDGIAMDFKVQRYKGEPVLTFWEGKVVGGHGLGEYVIADTSYRELRRVHAGNGYQGDHHEFLITPQDTGLITIFNPVRADLSSVGGPKDGMVLDGIAQEIDIATGEVLFEWHSLDHVELDETFFKAFDYFHINSIDVDHDSNLLISARNTSTVYKIDRKSGKVIWRLGGKKSSFEMGPGTRTRYQHDARRQSDGTITIFDNGDLKFDEQSYGLVLELDEDNMKATLVHEYPHPQGRLVGTQGSYQVLPNGNVFIGWGSGPLFSEFSRDGELLFHARFPPEDESYRAFRFSWTGKPDDDPAVAAERGSDDRVTLYASWNGATEVASWQVVAGSSPERLEPVGFGTPREGFETAITVDTPEAYVGVEARDRSGQVLGTSRPIEP